MLAPRFGSWRRIRGRRDCPPLQLRPQRLHDRRSLFQEPLAARPKLVIPGSTASPSFWARIVATASASGFLPKSSDKTSAMEDKRRKEVRVALRRTVQLHIGRVGPVAATLYDVSKSGIAVEARRWIDVGTRVRIGGAGFAAEGEVRYCEPQPHGYRIGIFKTVGDHKGARGPQAIGQFMVSDPSVCQGQPTFRGTRVLVADVLQQVATGMDWNSVVEHWGGALSGGAIAEAAGMDNLLPYRVSEIGGRRCLDFFSKPFGPAVSSVGKGILVDTNSAKDPPGDEPWVQRMIRKSHVSVYGSSKELIDVLRTGDTVFYFQKGWGIIAAAIITGTAAGEFKPDSERYWDVRFLTATPSVFKPPYEALTVTEIRETLRFNFLWQRTLKVPYLDAEQTAQLLQAVIQKIGAADSGNLSEMS